MALETETNSTTDSAFADGIFDVGSGKPLDGTAEMDKGSGANKTIEKAPPKEQAIDPAKLDAKKTEVKADDGKTKTVAAEGDKTTDAVVKALELKFPDGVKPDAKVVGEFTKLFTDEKVSNETAQKIIDKFLDVSKATNAEAQKAQQAQLEQTVENWKADARKDKEIGGAKFDESVALAKKGLAKFGTDELAKALKETGFASHKEFIRLFSKVGRALFEDSVKGSSGGGAAGETKDPLKDRYPTMFKE